MAGRKRSGRGDGLTLEERVWRWLKKQQGPVKVVAVREHFHVDRHAAGQCLRRLVKKGSASTAGCTHTTTYTATTIPPFDLRGTAPGSLRVCAQYRAPPFQGTTP